MKVLLIIRIVLLSMKKMIVKSAKQLYTYRTYNYNIIYFIPYYITIIEWLFYVWNICLIVSIDSLDCIDCIDSIDCIDYIEYQWCNYDNGYGRFRLS